MSQKSPESLGEELQNLRAAQITLTVTIIFHRAAITLKLRGSMRFASVVVALSSL